MQFILISDLYYSDVDPGLLSSCFLGLIQKFKFCFAFSCYCACGLAEHDMMGLVDARIHVCDYD